MVSNTEAITSVAPQMTQPLPVSALSRVPEAPPPSENVAEVSNLTEVQNLNVSEIEEVELMDDPLGLSDSFLFARELSEAEPSSVIAAQTAAGPPLDAEALAEARRIQEAFQADVNMTTLLEIIRGADLGSFSLLAGDPEAKSGVANASVMPV